MKETNDILNNTNLVLGNSQMANLFYTIDWSKTELGPVQQWPQSLCTALNICFNSRFPMFVWWGDSYINFYNDTYSVIAGSMHPVLFAKPAKKSWGQVWDRVEVILEKVKATGEATWSEDEPLINNSNGEEEVRFFTYSYSPIHTEAGKINGIFCAVTETTDKVLTLKKLEESQRNYINLIRQAPLGLCLVKNEPPEVEIVNEAFVKLLGKNPTDFTAKKYWDILPETKEVYAPIFNKVRQTGVAYRGKEHKVMLVRNNIEEFVYVDFVYEPIVEPDGHIDRLLIIAIDVTEKVLARKKIEESELDFRQLANTLPQLVWTTDEKGNQLFASKRWKEFSGLEPAEPETWAKMVHPKDMKLISEIFNDSLATGKPYRAEVRLKSKEGNYEWHYVLGESIRNEKGIIEKWSGAFTNFNEQKLAEESMMLQSQVLESMDEGVSVADEKGTILFTNSAEDHMFGYEPGLMVGELLSVQNAYSETENKLLVAEILSIVLRTGSWSGEMHKIKKDGTTFFTQTHISSTEVGERNLIVSVQRNITTEKAYKEQLKRFKFMADNATDAFILMKEDASFAYLNDLALERWGYSREEAATLRVPDVDVAFNTEEFDHIFKKAQHEKIEKFETSHKRKDGSSYPVEINMGGLVLDDRPYMFAVARDITESNNVREALSLSLQRFQLMSDTMAQFVWTANAEGKLDYFNKSVFDYSGFSFEKLQSDGWLQMVHPDDQEENVRRWIQSVTSGEHFIFQHRFKKHDGEYRWQLSRAIPQYNEEGKIQLWVGTSTDIHDQKIYQEKLAKEVTDRTQELSDANLQLQKSNAELEQFAYVASHDLQEPLRKIRTFASMLSETNSLFSEKDNGYISKIMASSERMSVLINDILNFSKVSRNDVAYVPVNLEVIFENVL
ncbi:MAG: PAS domain S-box protein, partial [Ferruginibacter sp.]